MVPRVRHDEALCARVARQVGVDKSRRPAQRDTQCALLVGDTIYGGDEMDHIEGGKGRDYIEGGNGDDYLYGNDGRDNIFGNAGNDRLSGGQGMDDLHGGLNDDHLWGGYESLSPILSSIPDRLWGDDPGWYGNDTFYKVKWTPGAVVDKLWGQPESKRLVYEVGKQSCDDDDTVVNRPEQSALKAV